jgi:hypothetical protein
LQATHSEDNQDGLGPDIGRRPPEVLPGTDKNLPELRHEGSHKFVVLRLITVGECRGTFRLGRCQRVQSCKLLLDVLELGGVSPDLVPVDNVLVIVSRLDDLKHVLGGVGIRGARRSTVSFKILEEGLRFISEV